MIETGHEDLRCERVWMAARQALNVLSNMTASEFELGEDRSLRRELADALGLDPADYSL